MKPFDLPPDPPTDLDGPPLPALVSGTSQEFSGARPLPRVIRSRTMVFVLGPVGVGKTTVAKSIGGPDARYISSEDALSVINAFARTRTYDSALEAAETIVLECPSFLDRRPAALNALQVLLRHRAGGGRRTVVCEAASGTPLEDLMAAVHPGYRATVMLRFPVGRGRKRYALRVCDELGVSSAHASGTETIEPWTYAAVRAEISTRS